MITIYAVHPDIIHQVWSQVAPYLEAAIEKDGANPDYKIDHIQTYIALGQWDLLVAADSQNKIQGAMTVCYINYPMHRVAFITTIGGTLVTGIQTHEQLKRILKAKGATKIQAYCQAPAVRLFQRYGMMPRATLLESEV